MKSDTHNFFSSPKYVRTSLAGSISLGMEQGRFTRGCGCYCLNILLNYEEGCCANCGYCGLSASRAAPNKARSGSAIQYALPQNSGHESSASKHNTFIRVRWPVYSLESILSKISEGRHPFKRVCVSMVTHPRAVDDACAIFGSFASKTNLPVSALLSPTIMNGKSDILSVRDAGADRAGIAVDAATPVLFNSLRGAGVGGPHTWERYFEALEAAVSVFGRYKAAVHLIAGLGETEKEMVKIICDCHNVGALTHLFSFYPEPGSLLENLERPSISRYRRIQLARYLINESISRYPDFGFSAEGRIVDFGVDIGPYIEKGLPFMTSGCPGRDSSLACNRPFGNERPGEAIRNFHFMPNDDDKKDIASQICAE